MKYLLLFVLALTTGCVNYSSLCRGCKPGQYYIIRRQNFVFFSTEQIIELEKVKTGLGANQMRYVRKVYPGLGRKEMLEEEEEDVQEEPKKQPVPTKEQPKKQEGPRQWGGTKWQ